MNTYAVLATITSTAVAAAALMFPVEDTSPHPTSTPAPPSTRPHVDAHGPNRPTVPCGQGWRLDPAGRHWLMATRLGRYDPCPPKRPLVRARQLEHDPLR